MKEFLQRYGAAVIGILSGFDRVVFRGTLRNMAFADGLMLYLSVNKIMFKDAGAHFHDVSERVKAASVRVAEEQGRQLKYLPSSQTSKEEQARKIAKEERIDSGLICVLTSVEPCQSVVIHRDRQTRHQHIRYAPRKCLHYYFYWMHDQLANAQLSTAWPRLLNGFAAQINPLYLRQGVADLYRRAEVSQACNDRYLAALAKIDDSSPLEKSLHDTCRVVEWEGRQVRALNPFGADAELLSELGRGEYLLNGFRNRDLQAHLYKQEPKDDAEKRARSGQITRKLRMLRAHGLIKKVPKTHRYQLTDKGRRLVVALGAAKQASTKKLTELAA